jgi:hypothetical protein
MIRNEAECQEASKRLGEGTERPEQHGTRLKEAGLDEDEIKRVIDPLRNPTTFATWVACRSPRESPTGSRGAGSPVVWADTKRKCPAMSDEYFGITLERAAKILDACGVRLRSQVAIEPLQPFPVAHAC